MTEIDELELALESVEPSLEKLLVQYEMGGLINDYIGRGDANRINGQGFRFQIEALVERLGLARTRELVQEILKG